MRIFSWKALTWAPLPVPFLYSLALVIDLQGGSPGLGFLLLFALGSLFSYGATAFLFLPCLMVIARIASLSAGRACGLGTLLGAAVWLPVDWVMYRASGPDSAPPEGTFAEHFVRDLADPISWVFPFGGLVTAALYWSIVMREAGPAGRR